MIVFYLENLFLAFVQGVSEFIPVSSSAHLLIISKLYNFNSSSLEIDVSLHLGSLIAIIFYFRKDLINIFNNKNLLFLIIFGSLPIIIVGFLLYNTGLIDYLRNIKLIAWTTLIFGIILYVSDQFKTNKKLDNDLNFKNILLIGLFQVIALIPGVSRSGITITAGRFLNFNRFDATKISFYLSIPALAGASFLGLNNIFEKNLEFNLILIFSTISSFIFSYLTIKYFLIYIQKFSLKLFVYYRIILAGILLIILYS